MTESRGLKLMLLFVHGARPILGVLQGSILGPLLFNIYLNDLFMFLEGTRICNYADDTPFMRVVQRSKKYCCI